MKKLVLLLLTCALLSTWARASDLVWLTDLNAARKQAEAANKVIFVNFTGSDWCGACIKMEREALASKEFAEYARAHLVLVELDFPRRKAQKQSLKKRNQQLQATHQVKAFPTLLIMNAQGRVLLREVGYGGGGAQELIGLVEQAKR